MAADALIGLLEHCKQVAPGLSLHLLTNGRRFADPEFTRRYAAVGLADIMAGIPLYAATPARSATLAAASSPQAATASASTCARYRDQPAETETQGTPPLTGLVFDLSEPHIPAQLKPRAEPWQIGLYHRGVVRYFAWSCR